MTIPRRPRPNWLSAVAHLVTLAIVSVVLVACAAGPAGRSPGSGTPGPTAPIEHSTGAKDVILRYEEAGGFVAPGFLVTEAPWFTLYGDGTAIFRDRTTSPPDRVGQVARSAPFLFARLTEEQIQELVRFSLEIGGLEHARDSYELPVADAPTTVFSLNAGGIRRRVSVNGLAVGAVQPGNPDGPILAQLVALRARLAAFGSVVSGEQPWTPDRYRGVLLENAGRDATGAVSWPWPAIAVADFTPPGDPDGPAFPTRVMTPAEVALLPVSRLEGGATGFVLNRPAGDKAGPPLGFGLRVLLPDEGR